MPTGHAIAETLHSKFPEITRVIAKREASITLNGMDGMDSGFARPTVEMMRFAIFGYFPKWAMGLRLALFLRLSLF